MLTVTGAVLQSIAVTPANPSIAKGSTQQFTATGTFSDNSTQNLTNTATWVSATPSVATINSTGLATGVGVGTSTISATQGSVTGSTVLTVTGAVLQSIAVTPANPSVAKGLTQQFTATGTFSDSSTQNLTNTVTWASATPSVATISNTGLATGAGVGTSTISATQGSVSGSTVLTVTAAVLESIAVTPANPSIVNGSTQQFTATGTFSDNSTQNLTNTATWASATHSVATINAAGLATAVGVGTSTISATVGSVSGSTVLTVTAAAPATVTAVSAKWGTQTMALQTNGDGLRLLPAGRNTDMPWVNLNAITITLSAAETLSPGDVSVTGISVANYGPVTISGSGTSYTITLAQAVSKADRVTVTVGNAGITTFTRRLDVLPGDVNDDGLVSGADGVLILQNFSPPKTYSAFRDLNGDGVVNTADFNAYRPNLGTALPNRPILLAQLAVGGDGSGAAALIDAGAIECGT